MKQFVFLIDTGNETREHKINATGMTDAVNRIKDIKNHLKKDDHSKLNIKFKGVIYENAY
ncbi:MULTISPECIES: hypothetical protein [Metabacillus]|jgi:hypothetical protein|uniref:Uncharacterized protein n=1 Tax=Metabacillus rhizolycopersici TaxID=2875709 RepID=A0ABS7UXQ0_9BACI|nr:MULTISPECIES: hypothetical protein [Metabacillus]MBZ5752710.1 hypothetical protein [Metabacillus rhizolycopersici]MCM3652559.1 hypothetical protein [Metabacillus litoralis]